MFSPFFHLFIIWGRWDSNPGHEVPNLGYYQAVLRPRHIQNREEVFKLFGNIISGFPEESISLCIISKDISIFPVLCLDIKGKTYYFGELLMSFTIFEPLPKQELSFPL